MSMRRRVAPRPAFQQLRKEQGLSQPAAAARGRLSLSTIHRWEAGIGEPHYDCRPKLAKAYGLTLQDFNQIAAQTEGLDSDRPTNTSSCTEYAQVPTATYRPPTPAGDRGMGIDMDPGRRRLVQLGSLEVVLAAFGVPGSVQALFAEPLPSLTKETLQALSEGCAEDFHLRSAALGSAPLCDVAVAIHRRALRWLHHGGYGRALLPDLERLCCELGVWAGFLAYESGRIKLARRYLHETIVQARDAGCAVAEADATASLCRVFEWQGRPHDARTLAEATLAGTADDAPPRMTALLHMRAATASASLGDHAGFSRQLTSAERAFELESSTDVSRTHFLNHRDFRSLRSQGALLLGQDLAQVVADFGDLSWTAFRNNAPYKGVYFNVWQGRALAKLGDGKQAAELGLSVASNADGPHFRRIRKHLGRLAQDALAADPSAISARELALALRERGQSIGA